MQRGHSEWGASAEDSANRSGRGDENLQPGFGEGAIRFPVGATLPQAPGLAATALETATRKIKMRAFRYASSRFCGYGSREIATAEAL